MKPSVTDGPFRVTVIYQIVAAAFFALGLSACGDRTVNYFPLEKGMTRVYRQTVITRNKGNAGGFEKSELAAAATDLAPRTVGGKSVVPRLYSDGRVLYFTRSGDGVALIGKSEPGEETPEQITPRQVLKLPLAVGATWTSNGETEGLHRTFLGGYGAINKPVAADGPIVYTVESVEDTVRVPAGTFHHCLRVHGVGSGKFDWGQPFGMLTVTMDVMQWYAPGVGLVKRVRKEGTGPDGPLGAELDEELDGVIEPGWLG